MGSKTYTVAKRNKKAEAGQLKGSEIAVSVKNFGPISDGTVTIKPLTIFIGPNNSGKSYFAMLIRGLFKSLDFAKVITGTEDINLSLNFRNRYFEVDKAFDIDNFISSVSNIFSLFVHLATIDLDKNARRRLDRYLQTIKGQTSVEVPKDIVSVILYAFLKEQIVRSTESMIKKIFASPLEKLKRIGMDDFSIQINLNSFYYTLRLEGNELTLDDYAKNLSIVINFIEEEEEHNIEFKKNKIIANVPKMLGKHILSSHHNFLMYLLTLMVTYLFTPFMRSCYYLPAARSGILQGYKVITSSAVELMSRIGTKRIEIPQFSGIISEFITTLIQMSFKKGPLYKLTRDLEKELVEGVISIRKEEKISVPDIKFAYKKEPIPLHRVSSAVSELAPLILYLKYLVKPNTFLIIEEPEAHLHPEKQRILAKFIVRLIRKGVNLIITTHSDFLLEQISNFIMISMLSESERTMYGYDKSDYLDPEEVAVYLFKRTDNGTRIKQLEMTEDGIPQEEFLRVEEELYKELIKLRKAQYKKDS